MHFFWAHNASKMRWRQGCAAPDPAERAYSAPQTSYPNLTEKRKGCERIGEREKRKGEEKVGEGMEGRERGEIEVKKEPHALQFCQLEMDDKPDHLDFIK